MDEGQKWAVVRALCGCGYEGRANNKAPIYPRSEDTRGRIQWAPASPEFRPSLDTLPTTLIVSQEKAPMLGETWGPNQEVGEWRCGHLPPALYHKMMDKTQLYHSRTIWRHPEPTVKHRRSATVPIYIIQGQSF